MRRACAAALLGWLASPAAAEIDLPRATPAGPGDGTWVQLTAVAPIAERATVAAQYGRLGGTRIRYGAAEFNRRLGGGFAAGLAYGYGRVEVPDVANPRVHLVRLAATWDNGRRPIEFDARLWGEVLIADPGPTREQVRGRVRATFALPGLPAAVRPFVAEEVFVEHGVGVTRNRVSLGLRTRPLPPLSLDLACQRSDDRGGAGQNVLLVQATWLLARRAQ